MQPPQNNHYEVVSIKRGVEGRCGPKFSSPLQFYVENCPLRYLIGQLYRAAGGYDLVGLPKWTSSEWYTITAKSIGPATPLEQWAMLMPVLEDRFGLKWHREKRQMPVYFLSVSKDGIRFPVTAPGSCVPFDPDVGPPRPDPNKPPSCKLLLTEHTKSGGIIMRGSEITMAHLTQFLKPHFDRPVLDRTGLTERFDVRLTFAPNLTIEANEEPLPSVFAALKKAGLMATRGEGAVDVLVVDHIEKPVED
jgi:uncharacterized protein (TIGR03435 family)